MTTTDSEMGNADALAQPRAQALDIAHGPARVERLPSGHTLGATSVGGGVGLLLAGWANLLPTTDPLKGLLIIASPLATIVCQAAANETLRLYRDRRRSESERLALQTITEAITELDALLEQPNLAAGKRNAL